MGDTIKFTTKPPRPDPDDAPEFIVAEIVTNWPKVWPLGPNDLIAAKFEAVIAHNLERGYTLHSFQLHRLMTDAENMNETIIAVFERVAKEGGAT